jgi:Tfp pilus assembly PilM family ATPase
MTSSSSFAGDTFFGIDLKQVKTRWQRFRRRVSKRLLLIDFGTTSITLAEAQLQVDAISFYHVQRFKLPEDALERGVPAEPTKMAGLIRGYCQEANIPAHRVAVVLPHGSAYTTVVKLPSSVPPAMALEYALDPASGVQIPVQIDQMDTELTPLALVGEDADQRSYFLTAVPRKLVDRVLDTLQAADMELVRLQVGVFAQLQHLSATMAELGNNSVLLHLELLRDCTLATLLSASGPIKVVRLTAIRDFPEPPESVEATSASSTLSAEAQIIASDVYMPLSELDLRRLNQELAQFIADCALQHPSLSIEVVVLAGWNSSHPLLDSLLHDSLALPVHVSYPLSSPGVGQFTPDQPMVLQGVGRLVGLGLSLMPALPDAENLPAEELLPELEPDLQDRSVLDQPLFDQPVVLELTTTEDFSGLHEIQIVPNTAANQDLVVEREALMAEAPILSFADASEELPALAETVEDLPLKDQHISNPSLSEEDEIPFSLGDLMSSFEAKSVDKGEPNLDITPLEDVPSADLGALDDSVYLPEDPALWPSIAKVDAEQNEASEDAADNPTNFSTF